MYPTTQIVGGFQLLGHKLDFESDDYAEDVGETPAPEEFDFEYEEHNEKEGETPASKETGIIR